MKALLDEIVENKQAAELQAAQEKEAAEQEFIEAAVVRFKLALGLSGLDWLFDFGEITHNWVSRELIQLRVTWNIAPEKCYELMVSSISINTVFFLENTRRLPENASRLNKSDTGEHVVKCTFACRRYFRYKDSWEHYNTFEEMVVKAREYYLTWAEEELAAKVSEALKKSKGQDALNRNWNKEEAEARKLHAELCKIAPDRKGEWDRRLETWLEEDAEIQARDAADEARKVELQAALDSYRAEYVEWREKATVIHEQNKLVAAKVQTVYDTPVTLYELEYGIVAKDFDGEEVWEGEVTRHVETRKVIVRTPGDKKGNFLSLNHNPVHWWNPVRTEAFIAVASKNPRGAYEIHGLPSPFDGDGFDICVYYITGAADAAEIEQALKDAGWQEYPTRPERPQHVPYLALNEIESHVENDMEPESESTDEINTNLSF